MKKEWLIQNKEFCITKAFCPVCAAKAVPCVHVSKTMEGDFRSETPFLTRFCPSCGTLLEIPDKYTKYKYNPDQEDGYDRS